MKKATILALAMIAIFTTSCGNSTTKNTDAIAADSTAVQVDSTKADTTKVDSVEGFHTPIN
jgi:hypothetical protein